jgi:hypothetical protein
MKSNNVTYTSTLSLDLMQWIESMVAKYHCSKKHLIETALLQYKEQTKKQELIATFKQASQDKEILSLAEEGLDDYILQIK